jgi:hypothetical protein
LQLKKAVQKAVDRGEIPLENAYMLAKIPRSMQADFMDRAKVMPRTEFRALAAACIKQFKEAVKQGKMDAFYAGGFQPVGYLRSLKEIDQEQTRKQVGGLICTGEDCKSVLDGFYAGLRWVCHLDRASVKEQEEMIRQKQKRKRRVLDADVNAP